MRIDLFEFIDGLFRGIVYFFYNLIGTAWMVLRHPMRGPALLYRAHEAAGQRQVGGLTFLFVTYFGVYAAYFWVGFRVMGAGERPVLTRMSDALSRSEALSGSLDTNWWWTVFLASFASTVLIDSVLRLGLRWSQRDVRKRQAALARTEFAMFLAAVPVTLGASHFALAWFVASHRNAAALLWLPWGIPLFVVACAAAAPAAAQLRRRGQPQRRPVLAAGIPVRPAVLVLGLGALAVAASVLGVAIAGYKLISDDRVRNRVAVLRLTCHILEDRPFVDALLHNRSRTIVAVDPVSLMLSVGRAREDARGVSTIGDDWNFALRAGDDAYGAAMVIRPGEAALVRAWLTERPPATIRAGMPCRLRGTQPLTADQSAVELDNAGAQGTVSWRPGAEPLLLAPQTGAEPLMPVPPADGP
ncbi:MAG: hypothetical protein QOG13_554 [Sphingomonadales bacterium]|jgi:hypothetical protein|nr:hypothetical protein [Sphingomonadales bacterium]